MFTTRHWFKISTLVKHNICFIKINKMKVIDVHSYYTLYSVHIIYSKHLFKTKLYDISFDNN